ncbi:MAG: flavodoxin [Ruminococcaceae bacterium]|nr:flavodoxin [Oscillospiraceae bacterium]
MNKTAIVYWSGTGNTLAMAKAIAKGMHDKGAEVDLLEVSATSAAAMKDYPKIAFGCPSMGDEVLEESDYEPFFTAVEGSLGGKKVALFGSYGWGDGQWMRDWYARTKATGASLMDEGFIQNEAPDEAACEAYGRQFADY